MLTNFNEELFRMLRKIIFLVLLLVATACGQLEPTNTPEPVAVKVIPTNGVIFKLNEGVITDLVIANGENLGRILWNDSKLCLVSYHSDDCHVDLPYTQYAAWAVDTYQIRVDSAEILPDGSLSLVIYDDSRIGFTARADRAAGGTEWSLEGEKIAQNFVLYVLYDDALGRDKIASCLYGTLTTTNGPDHLAKQVATSWTGGFNFMVYAEGPGGFTASFYNINGDLADWSMERALALPFEFNSTKCYDEKPGQATLNLGLSQGIELFVDDTSIGEFYFSVDGLMCLNEVCIPVLDMQIAEWPTPLGLFRAEGQYAEGNLQLILKPVEEIEGCIGCTLAGS